MPLTEGCQLIAIVFSVISAAAPTQNSTGQRRAFRRRQDADGWTTSSAEYNSHRSTGPPPRTSSAIDRSRSMIDYWMSLCRGQRTCGVGARVHGRRLTARHHLRIRTVHTLLDLDIQPLMPADVRDVDDRGGQTGACQKFPNPIQISLQTFPQIFAKGFPTRQQNLLTRSLGRNKRETTRGDRGAANTE